MGLSTKEIAATIFNSGLYAVGSYLTSYIPTPWIVRIRAAVIFPVVFAVMFGPLVGGLAAAIGAFIASNLTCGTPLLTVS